MTPEIAKVTAQFMGRVQLTGQEVPAFNAVMKALEDILEPKSDEAETSSSDAPDEEASAS